MLTRSDRPLLNGDCRLLGYLFLGKPEGWCLDTTDSDESGKLDITDAVRVLNHIFLGTAAPQAPHPARRLDPTQDNLQCRGF